MAVSQEKQFLILALVLALGSASVCGVHVWRQTRLASNFYADVQLGSSPYTPTVSEATPVITATWSQPPAQSRGREWLYDTFTPPEIFYSPRSKHFTVKPPIAGDEMPEEPFGLELVSVRQEPFRLQLIGYVGGEGNWRGTFQNLASGEVFLATAGFKVPRLGVTIRSFDVQLVDTPIRESMTTRQRVATALIHDDRTGQDVTITHRERRYTGTVSAFVAAPGETATREVRAGDTLKLGPAVYKIDQIQLAPPVLEVTKDAPTLPQPDHRTLTPRENEDAAASATPDAPASTP